MNNLLQALMYFFEKIQAEQSIHPKDEKVVSDLKELGFPVDKLDDAISDIQKWSDADKLPEYPLQPHSGSRVFDAYESTRLTEKSRSIILALERMGILTPETREQVIDQALNLEAHPIYPSHVKWVALMAVSKQKDKVPAAYIERLLLHESNEQPH